MPRIALTGLAALAVAMGVGRFAFTPMLPLMQDDAGVSLVQGGYLASANYVGYFAGALWATLPARSPRAIRGALGAIVITTLAMAFVHSMAWWLLLRFLAGVASAWALVHVSSWSLARLPPARAGVVFSGVGWGIALAGGLCLALTCFGVSSGQAWIALGAVALLIAAAVWPNVRDESTRAARREAPSFVWSADALRLVLCYGAFGFGYVIPATFVPVMAKAVVTDPAWFGWAWPLFGASAAVSTMAAACLASRYGHRRIWSAASLAMAAGVAAPLVLAGLSGIVLSALLVGGTFMVITMAGMQEARNIAGTQAPALMAAMTASFAAGQIAGPLAVSYVVQRPHGFALVLALASVVLVLSAAALASKEKPCPT